jgi:pimeloyl-ACP methyl ester carboxylesterase
MKGCPSEGDAVQGHRHTVTSADGTEIGLLTAGTGPALLLVHGGMGRLERWAPLWELLTGHWQVTAMDRRGRGSSGDTGPYRLSQEYDDVAAVAASLADDDGRPPDVFAHSYGALCALGAAAHGAPFRRIALYEPPGPQTVPREWRERAIALVAAGRPGPAMISFLTEIIGLTMTQISELRNTPGAQDVLPIVSATLPRGRGPGVSQPGGPGGRRHRAGPAPARRGQPGLGGGPHARAERRAPAGHPGRPAGLRARGHRRRARADLP